MRMNSGSLGDEQSTGGAGPLSIILKGKISMNVIFVGPQSCHRTEDDAMVQVHTANTDRLEKLRRCRHFESNSRMDGVDVVKSEVFGGDSPMDYLPDSLYTVNCTADLGFHSFVEEFRDARVDQRRADPSANLLPEKEKSHGLTKRFILCSRKKFAVRPFRQS